MAVHPALARLGTLVDAQRNRRACAKGTPRLVEKMNRDRAEDKAEREAYAKVDARDQHRCFWGPTCKTYAGDHHHVIPRSRGGKHTTKNLISACRKHHDYFKAGLCAVKGNPDRGPVKVRLTKLGREAKIRLPLAPSSQGART